MARTFTLEYFQTVASGAPSVEVKKGDRNRSHSKLKIYREKN